MKNLLAALCIFVVNLALNLPLFSSGESPYRQSIELGYAGISRFITEHPNPWGWNPFVYCGLPTQSLYLPVVPYAVAVTEVAPPHDIVLPAAAWLCSVQPLLLVTALPPPSGPLLLAVVKSQVGAAKAD